MQKCSPNEPGLQITEADSSYGKSSNWFEIPSLSESMLEILALPKSVYKISNSPAWTQVILNHPDLTKQAKFSSKEMVGRKSFSSDSIIIFSPTQTNLPLDSVTQI